MQKLTSIFFVTVLIFSFSFNVLAQSDGSAGGTTPPPSDLTTTPTEPANSTTTSTPAPASTGTVTPKSTTPKAPIPAPTSTLDSEFIPIVEVNPPAPESNSNSSVVLIAAGALIIGTLGFFGLNLQKKKKEEKDDKKCLNLKKLMEEKLNELTDLESKFKALVKEKAIEQVKKTVAGTKTEDLIILFENSKKDYERLKELYEKCITSITLPKTTALFLRKPSEKQILLAMKKRGLGEGKWNAVGGKLNERESLVEALVREAEEEIGVKVNPNDLMQVATLDFNHKDRPEWNQQTHVFFTDKWEGDPVETEEMAPKWHSTEALPYDSMWVDDPHWLPLVLAGKKIEASFVFDKEGKEILDKKIKHKDANN